MQTQQRGDQHMTTPRLRPYAYHVGQTVSLLGFPATVHNRLRTHAGRAMYVIQLAGEPACRHILEDGLQAAESLPVAA
jgi:hypothetical protein